MNRNEFKPSTPNYRAWLRNFTTGDFKDREFTMNPLRLGILPSEMKIGYGTGRREMGTTLQKLTSEVIEECLNQSMEVFGRPDSEAVAGYDWSEAQAFNEHVISSERLRAGMFCVVRAVFGEQVHSADAADGRIDAGELLETQKLTFSQLQMLEDLCRQFFFLGWHARGAVE